MAIYLQCGKWLLSAKTCSSTRFIVKIITRLAVTEILKLFLKKNPVFLRATDLLTDVINIIILF